MNRILGIALLVVGALLLLWGINTTQSFSSEMSEFFTGSPSDKAIWLIVLGVLSLVFGFFLSMMPGRRKPGP